MKEKKRLSKRQITAIIVISVAACVVIALAIALPLTLIDRGGTVEVTFLDFDRLSDVTVTAVWDKYKNADTYTVEYAYGNRSNVRAAVAGGTSIKLDRRGEVLSVRVKPNVKNGKFSEWAMLDIPKMKLSTPKVTISGDGIAMWNYVRYDTPDGKFNDVNYIISYGYDDLAKVVEHDVWGVNEFRYFAQYMVLSANLVTGNGEEWRDIVFFVNVKAVLPGDITKDIEVGEANYSKEELFLQYAYSESEYGRAELTMTKDIYENLKRLYNL